MAASFTHRAGGDLLALLFVLVTTTASAQQREFVEAQRANSDALRSYTWKTRTELKLKDEVRNVRLEQVRYDFAGQLQKTPIGGGMAESSATGSGPSRGRGPLRQAVVAKKQEEFKELMTELGALAGSYAHLSPEVLKTFAARATVGKGQGLDAGTVRIQGRAVLTATDEMVVWIDPIKSVMRRVEITTAHEGKPVRIVADYRSLENGLTYQAHSVMSYPDKQLTVTIEGFDYEFTGRPR
jgi:hypothetical protein